MALKRPKLKRREEAQQFSAPTSTPAQTSSESSGGGGGGGTGISPAALQAALGGTYSAPMTAGSNTGITSRDLGQALTSGGGAGGNRSAYSTRHTSYPLPGDLTGLPAKAGTRQGPRTTSYRIPLQRTVQQNVYDTIN